MLNCFNVVSYMRTEMVVKKKKKTKVMKLQQMKAAKPELSSFLRLLTDPISPSSL